jgi:hypothetical protein
MKAAVLAVAVALIFLLHGVYSAGEGWKLLTGKMILRVNLSEGGTAAGRIGVENENDNPVNITLIPGGDIKDIIQLDETDFTLPGKQKKWVNFTVSVPSSGTYYGNIAVKFTGEDEGGFSSSMGLSADIIVIAGDGMEKGGTEPENTGTESAGNYNEGKNNTETDTGLSDGNRNQNESQDSSQLIVIDIPEDKKTTSDTRENNAEPEAETAPTGWITGAASITALGIAVLAVLIFIFKRKSTKKGWEYKL